VTTNTVSAEGKMVPWWLVLLQGIAAVIIGLLLLTATAQTVTFLVVFLGFYWLISGIFGIVSIFVDSSQWGWKLFLGILGIVAGIIVLNHPLWAAILVPTTLVIVLGIQGIIIGVIGLIQAFQGAGWGVAVLGVLSIIFGLILLFNPMVAGVLALPIVLGIFGIVGGILAIIAAFQMK
jgi:uncharacterized membrane protein HdeD (DUF308 family)